MHILTKIFVVLAALLSLLVSALAITYSINAERISDEFGAARRAEDAATTALRLAEENHKLEVTQLRGQLETRNVELADLRGELDESRYDAQRLAAEKRAAEAQTAAVQSQVRELGVTADTLTKLVETYRDEVTNLRDQELTNRDQRLDLEDTIADQSSRLQVFEQTVRALREQLADARQQIEELGSGRAVARNGGAAAPRTIPGTVITGTVEDVRDDSESGRTLVQVDLGSNDGVSALTELDVVRGQNYVGTIVVDEVDLQASVGYVRLTNGNLKIRRGDQVRSRLAYID